jgi:hypothetical protein
MEKFEQKRIEDGHKKGRTWRSLRKKNPRRGTRKGEHGEHKESKKG